MRDRRSAMMIYGGMLSGLRNLAVKGHDEVELYMFRRIYSYRSPALSLFSKLYSFYCTYWALGGFSQRSYAEMDDHFDTCRFFVEVWFTRPEQGREQRKPFFFRRMLNL